MKKTLMTSFIVASLVMTIKGQNLQGKYFVGGSIGCEFTSANADMNSNTYGNPQAYQSYNISPSGGYYLTNKLAIGIQLGYTSTTTNYLNFYTHGNKVIDSLDRFTITTKTFSIAPLLRYTIPVTDKFGFIVNITIPYSYTKSDSPTGNSIYGSTTGYIYIPANYSYNSYGLNISPGFQWFIKNKIAILGSLGALSYTHTKINSAPSQYSSLPAATDNTNDFKLSLSTSISLGLTFYFGGGK